MISIIKSLILRNVYIRDTLMRLVFRKLNADVLRDMHIFTKLDSIACVRELEDRVKKLVQALKPGSYYSIRRYGAVSLFYGHIQNLYKYAGIDYDYNQQMPLIEHGVFLDEVRSCKEFQHGMVAICQGDYMRGLLRTLDRAIPLFNIGPFIHYALDYYTKEKVECLRRANGKTMLVFLNHTCEDAPDTNYNASEFIEYVIRQCEKSYDKLYVCVYWLDLGNPNVQRFKERGAHIVSAGARFDPKFLHRLKTIISLSDDVYSNDIGTSIGYSKYLGKDYYIACPIQHGSENGTGRWHRAYGDLLKAFGTGSLRNTQVQDHLYNRFWGGSDSIRTPRQVRTILYLNKYLIRMSLGNVAALPDVIKWRREDLIRLSGIDNGFLSDALK